MAKAPQLGGRGWSGSLLLQEGSVVREDIPSFTSGLGGKSMLE